MSAPGPVSPAVRERRRVSTPLALAAGLAWAMLAVGGSGVATPAICSAALLWSVPSPSAFAFAFAFVSPWSLTVGWVVMVVAMMLPTVGDPLVHVRERTLARLRPVCIAVFLGGYVGVWTVAGVVLLAAAIMARLAAPIPEAPLIVASLVAVVWQVSPWRQVALNRCHRRPSLPAFAPAAYRSALHLGVTHGFWCVASCWALMATALLAPAYHVQVMAFVAGCIWAERLEPARPPRWRASLPSRALRMIARLATRGWPTVARFRTTRSGLRSGCHDRSTWPIRG